MQQPQSPRLPLPEPLMMSEPGSFAHYTLTERLPKLCRRLPKENQFSPDIVENLHQLAAELPEGKVRSLRDTNAPDIESWERYLMPYLGCRWLEIPWYFGEAYFYRRILEATRYFEPGEWQGVDPFAYQKQQGLQGSMHSIHSLAASVDRAFGKRDRQELIILCYFALWGNRVDLSLWSAEEGDRSEIEIDRQRDRLLVDATPPIADRLEEWYNKRIDIIADNAGFEVICDLCFADFLLGSDIAGTVNVHLKSHPTFVSDATVADVAQTIKFLSSQEDNAVRSLGTRLQQWRDRDRLILRDNFFWTSPLAFWEMPDALKTDLANADLAIVKGDANYRRLNGNRHWNFTTPLSEIVSYFPAPLVMLRTLKSEVAMGLGPGQPERLNSIDPDWLTDGNWGVIQIANW